MNEDKRESLEMLLLSAKEIEDKLMYVNSMMVRCLEVPAGKLIERRLNELLTALSEEKDALRQYLEGEAAEQ